MRSWSILLGVAAGCAAPRPSIVEAPHATAIELAPAIAAPALPVPAKPATLDRDGARDLVEPGIHGRVIALEARWRSAGADPAIVDVAEIDFLGRCARDFIVAQPESARRPLVTAFTHYVTICDPEGKLMLERPLGFDSRDRRTRSDAVFLGSLAARGAGLVLRVTSCNAGGSFDRVSIAGGDLAWTSPRLEVRREANGCEIAELPYTKALAKVILRATESESVLRFDGTTNELAITDQIRDELRSVLDAVDAITEP
ncbi:MAG: hypothetical protein H0V17_20490 [Deltaproteobacteria bacterium]|nr:hypothetical protein [Deltaproteobacteria bacterium]